MNIYLRVRRLLKPRSNRRLSRNTEDSTNTCGLKIESAPEEPSGGLERMRIYPSTLSLVQTQGVPEPIVI